MTSDELLKQAVQAAKDLELQTQFPARITLAQWALESGWGAHAPGNNCFGITEYGGCQGTQLLDTTEWFTDLELNYFLTHGEGHEAVLVQPVRTSQGPNGTTRRKYACKRRFATFRNLRDCFQYRVNLLTKSKRYKSTWDTYQVVNRDLGGLIDGIAKAGYATDPEYASKIKEIAFGHRINAAL